MAVPRWLPNAISAARIGLVPLWLLAAERIHATSVAGQPASRRALVVILLVLGGSDILDGFLARRFQLTSRLGATLDAVADKLAQIAFVTYLVFRPSPAFVPLSLWLWVTLVIRDGVLLVGTLAIRQRHGDVDTEHEWHGKAASVILFFVVFAVCLWGEAPTWLEAATAIWITLSTLRYVQLGLRQYREGFHEVTR